MGVPEGFRVVPWDSSGFWFLESQECFRGITRDSRVVSRISVTLHGLSRSFRSFAGGSGEFRWFYRDVWVF